MRRILVAMAATALTIGATIGAAPDALATGGSYPSQAPMVVNGQTVSGGTTAPESCDDVDAGNAGVEYYRVALDFGAKFIGDLTNISRYSSDVAVFAPDATDYTINDASALAFEATSSTNKVELTFTAPVAGNYLIAVSCGGFSSWAYQLNVRVVPRIAPTIKLGGPKVGHIHQTIRLHGSISPALSKPLILKSKSPAHGWITAGRVKPVNGRFAFGYYLGHHGKHQFQVFFPGGGDHDASASRVLTVKVR